MSIDLTASIAQLADMTGNLWFIALAGSFLSMVCEAAKPKPEQGDARSSAQPLSVIAGVFSMLTPLMLFAHAFVVGGQTRDILIAIIAVIGGAIMGAAIIGWMVSAIAPGVGRSLNKAAPVLAIATFVLAAWISWQSVAELAAQLMARA